MMISILLNMSFSALWKFADMTQSRQSNALILSISGEAVIFSEAATVNYYLSGKI